jgi:hypothetical protein
MLALTLALSGCPRTRDCRPGTLLVIVDVPALPDDAYVLDVDVTLGGATRRSLLDLPRPLPPTVTVEIEFPAGYPTGENVTVTASIATGAALYAASGTRKMDPACGVLALDLVPRDASVPRDFAQQPAPADLAATD